MQILVDYLISLRNNALYDLNNQDNKKNKEDIYNFIKEIEKELYICCNHKRIFNKKMQKYVCSFCNIYLDN
jgi:hypothetical protein